MRKKVQHELRKKDFELTTPRQLGLTRTLEELYAARNTFLPECLRKEWNVFPDKTKLYPYLDTIPDPKMFNPMYFNSKEVDHKGHPCPPEKISSEDIAFAAAVHGAVIVAEAKMVLMDNMVTSTEYAIMNNRRTVLIKQKCLRECLPGAVKVGRDWLIPRNVKYIDYRGKTSHRGRYAIPKEGKKSDRNYYMSKTPRQIAYECSEAILRRDLNDMVPKRLRNRWALFSSVKVLLSRLDSFQTPDKYEALIQKKHIDDMTAADLALACAITCALCVAEARTILFYHMLPLTQYAERIHELPDLVRQKCLRGTQEGAIKFGTVWYVPEKAIYKKRNNERTQQAGEIVNG